MVSSTSRQACVEKERARNASKAWPQVSRAALFASHVTPPRHVFTLPPNQSREVQKDLALDGGGAHLDMWPKLPNHSWPQVLARPLLSIFF